MKTGICLKPLSESCTSEQKYLHAAIVLSIKDLSSYNDSEIGYFVSKSAKQNNVSERAGHKIAQKVVAFRKELYASLNNIAEDKCYAGPFTEVAEQTYTATIIQMFLLCIDDYIGNTSEEWEEIVVEIGKEFLTRSEDEVREMAKIALKIKEDIRNLVLNYN